jgi:hypothetical protein
MKKIILLLLLCLVYSESYSQRLFSPSNFNKGVGVFGNFSLNNHSAGFQELPDVPNCCSQFSEASGNGLSIGGFYEQPIIEYFISVQFRLGLYNRNARFIENEYEPLTSGSDDAEIAKIEHVIDAEISTLGTDILGKVSVWRSLSIYGGFNMSYLVIHKFKQVETLVEPSHGTFENGTRKRNQINGNIEETSPLQLSFVTGLSFDIQVSKNLNYILSPEIFYCYGLTDILSNGDKWKINSLRIGLSFKFGFLGPEFEYTNPLGDD